MTRLGLWLSMGMTLFGVPGVSAAENAESPSDVSKDHPQPFLGGFLRESRIVYPLKVGEWEAIGEHRFDEQEYGVSVRYAHGRDSDRWIDVYFYPAGVLSAAQFAEAARTEADLIGQAHRQAGHADFDIGELQAFSVASVPVAPAAAIPARAVDLGYTIHGTAYSSAMTLLLDHLYFVKARYSIEQARLSREDTLRQLEQFTAQLHPSLVVLSTGDCSMSSQIDAGTGRVTARAPVPDGRLLAGCVGESPVNPDVVDGMREIRIEYRAPDGEGHPSRSIGIGRIKVG
ncbi:hypothetical protein [Cognatiluteimonas profundi]|uniref:hypothetical protein n=1 Tax=Cognatiluteimonas profundi TaxID=2594501 RepID=UPI00131C0687|nr:hypothetical protein [Lysobacter profundi]